MAKNTIFPSGIYTHSPNSQEIPAIESSVGGLPPSTSYSRTAAYLPTTGLASYGTPDYQKRRVQIEEELKGAWVERPGSPESETSVLDFFFPNKEDSTAIFDHLKATGKYGGAVRSPAKNKNGQRGPFIFQGWTGCPSPPSAGEKGIDEKSIAAFLIPIINDIIQQLGLTEDRVAVDCQSVDIETGDGGSLKPDVFVWGKGAAFPPIDRRPSSTRHKRPRSSKYHDAPENPAVRWPWCANPIELKTERQRGGTENRKSFYQLGTYVREILAAQPHRRFVPTLLITECTIEFLLWDRSGVVVSQRLDYHQEPLLFCHILATILKWDDGQIGFDTTFTFSGPQLQMRTKEPFTYMIDEIIFRSYTVRGQGSTCWLAHKSEEDDVHYLIQESWIEGGMHAEKAIHDTIQNIRENGGATCAAPLVHIEEVEIPEPCAYPDTVQNIRRAAHFTKGNLVHTRAIFRCHSDDCKLLEKFSSPEELVTALHDVVKGLGDLHEKGSIIYRDITPWNVIIQPNAPEGSRGILFDFSSAVSTMSGTSLVPPETTPGAHLFRCQVSLEAPGTYASLAWVESFYYLLCFLVVGHKGPDLVTSRLNPLPGDLLLWGEEDEDAACAAKRSHLSARFKLQVQRWFGAPIQRLVANLHSFLQLRMSEIDASERPTVQSSTEDYHMIAKLFEVAVNEIKRPIILLSLDGLEDDEIWADDQMERSRKHYHGIQTRDDDDIGGAVAESNSIRQSKKLRLHNPDGVFGAHPVEIVQLFETGLVEDVMCGVAYCT